MSGKNFNVGTSENSTVIDISPSVIASFSHTPLTLVDVERSFSIMKTVLSDRRLSMTRKLKTTAFGDVQPVKHVVWMSIINNH